MWQSVTLYIHVAINHLSDYIAADVNLFVPGGNDDEDEREPEDGKLWLQW